MLFANRNSAQMCNIYNIHVLYTHFILTYIYLQECMLTIIYMTEYLIKHFIKHFPMKQCNIIRKCNEIMK